MNWELHKRPESSERKTRPITGKLPPQNQKQAEECFEMGKKHMIKNEFNEALKHYNNALIHNPKDIKSLCNIGKVYKELGNFQKSYDYYMQVLAINADDIIAIYNLANLERVRCNYENANGLYMRVFKLKEKGIKLGTLDYDSLVNRSICLEKLERYDESIDCCNVAIKINPNDVSAYFNKSMSLLKKVYESARCLFGNVTKELCEETDKEFDKILKMEENNFRCKMGKIEIKFLSMISKENLEKAKESLLELATNYSNITQHEISIKLKLFETFLNNNIKQNNKHIENHPIINNSLTSQKLKSEYSSVKSLQSKVGKQDPNNKRAPIEEVAVVARKESESQLTKEEDTNKEKGRQLIGKFEEEKKENKEKVEAEIGLIRSELKQKNYEEALNRVRDLADELEKYELEIEINTLQIEESSTSTHDKTELLENAISIYNEKIINNDEKTIITKDICSERGHEIMANMLNFAGEFSQSSKHYAALLQIVEDRKEQSKESKEKIKDIHAGLGSCYSEIGLIKEAIKEYEESLMIEPNNYFLMTNLCGLFIKDNRSKEAKMIYEKFLKENGGKDMSDRIPYIDSLVNISICDKDTPEEAKALDLAIKEIEKYYPTYEDISKNLDEEAILNIYLRKIDLLEMKLAQSTCSKEESQKINEELLDSYLSCLEFENCPDREAISINCGILFYLNKFYTNSLAYFNVISHPQTQRLITNNIGLAMVHVHEYEKAYSNFSLAVEQNPENILFNTNFEIIKWIYGVSELSKLKYSCKCEAMFENRVKFGIYMYDRLTKLLLNNVVKSEIEDGSDATIENTVVNLINELMSPIRETESKDPESIKYELISKTFNQHEKKCNQHIGTTNHQQLNKVTIEKYLKVCPSIKEVESGLKDISDYVSSLADLSPKITILKGLIYVFLALNSKSLGEEKVQDSWLSFQKNQTNLFLSSIRQTLTVENPDIKEAFLTTNNNRKVKCGKVVPSRTFEIVEQIVKDAECVIENTLQFAISKISDIYYSEPDSLASPLEIVYTHPHCGHTVTCRECLAKYLSVYTTIFDKKIKNRLAIKEEENNSEFFREMKKFSQECYEEGNPLFLKKEEEVEIKLNSKALPFKLISHHKTLNGAKDFLKVFNKSFILGENDSKKGIQIVELEKSLVLELWWGDLTIEDKVWHELSETENIVIHSNLLVNSYIDSLVEVSGDIESDNTSKGVEKNVGDLIRELFSPK